MTFVSLFFCLLLYSAIIAAGLWGFGEIRHEMLILLLRTGLYILNRSSQLS